AQVQKMEASGVAADVVVYSGVLDACAKANDTVRAKEVFAWMKTRGVRPNVVAYSALARPFAHRGDWQEVERLAEEMSQQGFRMNEYFVYAQLMAYANAKPSQPDRAEAIFRESCAKGVEANKHIMMALSRALGRSKSTQLARELTVWNPEEAATACAGRGKQPAAMRNRRVC
ncbi:unnamed protein product, partial [Polarella glacialis]